MIKTARLLDNKGDVVAETKSKSKSNQEKSAFTKYEITKDNGKVVFRNKERMGNIKLARIKKKGWKVKEV